MGMYDDIRYEGRDFQTKDLDCDLSRYHIENARLLREVWQSQELPESEWHPDSLFPDIIHKHKRVMVGKEDINHHGCLNFYTCNIDPKTGSPSEWEEYNAKFTDGALVEVVPVAG